MSERSGAAQNGYPTVQLRHELPDGSHHVDWMLATDPAGEQPLITFRLPRPLDDLKPQRPTPLLRLADHRPAFLTYEGPISRNRGQVKRVRRGRILRWDRPGEDEWELQAAWEWPEGGETRQQLRR